jgi:hypothetical protein
MHPDAAVAASSTTSVPAVAVSSAAKRGVRFAALDRDDFDSPLEASSGSSSDGASYSDVDALSDEDGEEYASGVLRDASSWAGNLPAAQGLVGSGGLFMQTMQRYTDASRVRSTIQRMNRTRAVWA